MEKGDILTLVGGLLIVLVIAVVANPQYLASIKGVGVKATPIPLQPRFRFQRSFTRPRLPQSISNRHPTPIPADAPPYQIFYTDKPFTYPVFKLPENMETYGASDIVSRNQEMVPFAFVR